MIFYDLIFHDCYFSVNINSYTTQIQSYMTMRKIIQNAEQNDEQNINEALGIYQCIITFLTL